MCAGSSQAAAVFAESFRVLRRGGRLGISDILAEDHLSPAQRLERGAQASCIAGAPSFTEYRDGLDLAGFTGITITPAHQVGDGVHAAIIRAAPALARLVSDSVPHGMTRYLSIMSLSSCSRMWQCQT